MTPPCGHSEEQATALLGKPWDDRGGWSPLCRVCWRWANEPATRAAWSQGPAPAPSPPLSPEKWPRWAKALAKRRRPGEAGVGDTLARVLAPLGGTAFKLAYRKLTGKDCGCDRRQALMNGEYPYKAGTGWRLPL